MCSGLGDVPGKTPRPGRATCSGVGAPRKHRNYQERQWLAARKPSEQQSRLIEQRLAQFAGEPAIMVVMLAAIGWYVYLAKKFPQVILNIGHTETDSLEGVG